MAVSGVLVLDIGLEAISCVLVVSFEVGGTEEKNGPLLGRVREPSGMESRTAVLVLACEPLVVPVSSNGVSVRE